MDRKRLALIAAVLGSFVAGLDATVVNVALPSIKDDLGGGLAGQQWISNAYLLTLGSLILIGGSLGDLFGERRVFSLGVGGFGVASLICAAAPSVELLVAARALQGVFGALLTPSALAVIIAAYPPAERGAAIGSWTAWTGIAFVVGPLAGGVIVDATSWRWIFLINIPFVVLTLFVVASAVEARPRPDQRPHVDVIGAVLCALGLGGPVYALTRQPDVGWGSPEVVFPLLAGLALIAAFLGWERRSPRPMLPLGLFKRRNFAVGNLQTVAMYGGLSLNLFTVVLFLQQVAGYTALESGLATMPVTVIMFLLSKRMGALADRFGPRLFMGLGPLLAACGLLLYLRVGRDAAYAHGGPARPDRLLPRAEHDGGAPHRDGARRRRRLERRHRLRHQQRARPHGRPGRRRRARDHRLRRRDRRLLPPRDGDRGGARRDRGGARPGRHRQPAPHLRGDDGAT